MATLKEYFFEMANVHTGIGGMCSVCWIWDRIFFNHEIFVGRICFLYGGEGLHLTTDGLNSSSDHSFVDDSHHTVRVETTNVQNVIAYCSTRLGEMLCCYWRSTWAEVVAILILEALAPFLSTVICKGKDRCLLILALFPVLRNVFGWCHDVMAVAGKFGKALLVCGGAWLFLIVRVSCFLTVGISLGFLMHHVGADEIHRTVMKLLRTVNEVCAAL